MSAQPSPLDAVIARWREALPEELFLQRIFLLWVRRAKAGKPGKFDKIPYYASGQQRHGANGSPADRAQLVELGDALLAYRGGKYSGIGIALLPDIPFWALDLDACVDGETLSPLAQRVVDSGTYCERSPSGNGVRALFAGKAGIDAKNHIAGVEVFDSRGFVTLTGERLGGESILPCPPVLLAEILAIVGAERRRSAGVAPHGVTETPPDPDRAVVKGLRLPRHLWQRLVSPYPPGCDRSAAALSIALALKRYGASAEQAFALCCIEEMIVPALERRGGDIQGARCWVWRYVIAPAYRSDCVLPGAREMQ